VPAASSCAASPSTARSELAAVEGCRGAYLLRRDHPAGTEFVTLTMFDGMEDVRRFAGADPEKANVSRDAWVALDEVDERVRHYTVVSGP
jgi:heme-degrading monooxygenase HmoA